MKRTLCAFFAVFAFAACKPGGESKTIQINGAGATFPNPIYSKCFAEYRKLHRTS